MKTARHLGMAVDLATARYSGMRWEISQMIATLAISFYVQSTAELQEMWDKLPEHKRTAQRHEKNH